MTVRSTILVSASVLLLAGCGSKPGRLTGRVSYNGAALPSGSVTLTAADGQLYAAALAADGTFALSDVPRGPARVAVKSHPHVPAGLLGKDRNTAAGRATQQFVRIPERYARADGSGLSVEVRGGDQECAFDLVP